MALNKGVNATYSEDAQKQKRSEKVISQNRHVFVKKPFLGLTENVLQNKV